MDFIVEYMVKKKKDFKDYLFYLLVFFVTLIALWVLILIIPYIGDYYWGASVIVIIGAFLFARKRNVEYEYSFVNGELDIDRIIARRRRRRMITLDVRSFKLFELVSTNKDDSYPDITRTINLAGDTSAENAYVAVLDYKGQTTRVYFQASEKMLEYIKKFIKIRG